MHSFSRMAINAGRSIGVTIMSKQQRQDVGAIGECNSFADIGYSQANAYETLEQRAKDALKLDAAFHDKVTDEVRAQLYIGYQRRYKELSKGADRTYAVINGNYVTVEPFDEAHKNPKVEKVSLTVDLVMGYTTYEIGQMAKSHGESYKALVVKLRNEVGTYCSNRLRDLQNKAKEIVAGDKKRGTRATHSMVETMKLGFTTWEKSVKVRAARGDESASPTRLASAITAFWEAYNK
jgi:hypothetical protein